MDLFEKASKAVQNVGENVVNSAKSVGNTIFSTLPEQKDLAGLKIQLNTVTNSLEAYYAQIGRRYMEYIKEYRTEAFDVNDILNEMSEKLKTKAELESEIEEKELEIKNAVLNREKQKAQEEFDRCKAKLENALTMGIITVDEYQEKLAKAQKKLDNFDILRKIELQYKMQIITKQEYEEKIKNVLGE